VSGRYTVHDWHSAANRQERVIEGELIKLRRRRQKLEDELRALEAREQGALDMLLAGLLPDGSPAAAARAAEWTRFAELAREPPAASAEREITTRRERVAEIERDPRWVERVALRDPDVGTLTVPLREHEEHLAPLDAVLRRAEHPRLDHLLACGYGTPDYDVGWWRLSYYRDWEAGDEVLEQFPDHEEDFGRFRDYYLELVRAAEALRAEVERLRAEVRAGEDLEVEHRDTLAAIQTAPQRALDHARQRLGSFLADLGPQHLHDLLDPASPAGVSALRWAGLRKQREYLDELERHVLTPMEQTWSRDLAKLRRKVLKFSRPKHRYTRFRSDEFERTFADRSAKYAQRWRVYDASYEALREFDRYHEGSLARDHLWWDTICDGRLKGKQLPSVARFRTHRPDYRYQRPKRRTRDDEAAAAAAIAGADAAFDDALDDYS